MAKNRYYSSDHLNETFLQFTEDFYAYLKDEGIEIDRKKWEIWMVMPARVKENFRDKDAIIDNFITNAPYN